MPVESAADIRAFFNSGEHGEAVNFYKDNAGQPAALSALVITADSRSDVFRGSLLSDGLVLHIPVIDLPDVKQGDSFDVRGDRFYVKSTPEKIDGGDIWLIEFGG